MRLTLSKTSLCLWSAEALSLLAAAFTDGGFTDSRSLMGAYSRLKADVDAGVSNLDEQHNQWLLTHAQSLYGLMAKGNFDQLARKALILTCSQVQEVKLDCSALSYIKTHGTRRLMESTFVAWMIIEQWCQQHTTNKLQLVQHVRHVYNKTLMKKNMFVLEGPSNSGKSLLLRSLLPGGCFYGEIHRGTAYNFMWQDNLDARLILMEEPLLDQTSMEHFKIVAEGQSTFVHIKMKDELS